MSTQKIEKEKKRWKLWQKLQKLAEPLKGRHNRTTTADLLNTSNDNSTMQLHGNRIAELAKYTGLDLLLQLAPQFLD